MMKKVIYFGTSVLLKQWFRHGQEDALVVAVADNHSRQGSFAGHRVIQPRQIPGCDYDQIIIALDDLKPGNDAEIVKIYNQLLGLGVPDEKIVLQSFKYKLPHPVHKPRTNYVYSLGEIFSRGGVRDGSIAECGVYRGWFSGILSEVFPESKLYLFDTFEGFSDKDVEKDADSAKEWVKEGAHARLQNTNEVVVSLRVQNRDRLHIVKGYVPETLENIEDQFQFVNLDMDLYRPQKEALAYFAPRMVPGGVILLHDYFSKVLPGTAKAVAEFDGKNQFACVPIGDALSIALVRK